MKISIPRKNRSILTAVFLVAVNFFLTIPYYQANSQNLIVNPECVVYDAVYNRYLVSCLSVGRVVEINAQGIQSYWKTGLGYCLGCTIYGNVFYISLGKTIKGYNLATGAQVMSVYIPTSHQLDGMQADTSGNLYIADFHYNGPDDQIFKINLTTYNYWSFVPPGHGLQDAPQDIAHDRLNNRLIVVSAFATPIFAVSLADSSVTTIFNSPTVNNFDGIAEDNWGNYYATSWGTGSVYKFDHNFQNTPVMIASGFNGPSNLCYNPSANKLAVPVYYSDTVLFITPPPIALWNQSGSIPNDFILFQNYPNPFNPSTTIKYSIPADDHVTLRVFDMLGKEVAVLADKFVIAGNYEVSFDASKLSSGIYFYKMITSCFSDVKKMILVK